MLSSVQSHSRVRLFDHMNHSTPGLPVNHQLPESTQTHVHWFGDAIQPSHPLLFPSPLALNLSQHRGLFNESALPIRWPKHWSFSLLTIKTNTSESFLVSWMNLEPIIQSEVSQKEKYKYCIPMYMYGL